MCLQVSICIYELTHTCQYQRWYVYWKVQVIYLFPKIGVFTNLKKLLLLLLFFESQ